ncbi:hypothetical protein [Aliivibrio logei]|uniref:hypothetical protein n=1 Tax=Aliivibrio logei TaxID=688 RepID=UPI0035C8AC33
MKQFLKMAMVASALAGILGCQSTDNASVATATETNSAVSSISTFDALQKQYLLDKVTFDSIADFKIYSATSYTAMMEDWSEAKEAYSEIEKEPSLMNEEYSMFSSGSYSAKYMELVSAADNELKKLKNYKETADVVLSDAIAQMAYMNSIDVNAYYPQEFSSLNSQYKALFVSVIEDGIAEAQTNQASFLTKAKVTEIKTTLKIYVTPLEKEFSGLTNKGFKAIAPISYGQTKAELDKTKKAVQANNRDQALIADAIAKTRFQLDHLKNMAAEVKLLKAVKNGQFEQSVLEVENKLLSISQAINGDDYRDQPLRTQTSSILDAVQQMHDVNNTIDLEVKIKELNAQIKTLEATIESQTESHAGVQKQVLVLTQQLERNDNLINNLNTVIGSYKEKEEIAKTDNSATTEEKVQSNSVKQEETVTLPESSELAQNAPTVEATSAKTESTEIVDIPTEIKPITEATTPIAEVTATTDIK